MQCQPGQKQLIERFPCVDDRRVVFISITKKGKQLIEVVSEDFNQELLKNITEEEAKQLSDLLDKMR